MTTYENLVSKIQEVAKEVKDQPETPKMIPFIEKMIDIAVEKGKELRSAL